VLAQGGLQQGVEDARSSPVWTPGKKSVYTVYTVYMQCIYSIYRLSMHCILYMLSEYAVRKKK